MNIVIQKKHEGKIIYGLPTGNNQRRSDKTQEPTAFMVVKVKRKYANLKMGDFSTESYCVKRGALQGQVNQGFSLNAGYLWFECLNDIEKYREFSTKKEKVRSFFGNNYNLMNVRDKDVESLYEIVSKY